MFGAVSLPLLAESLATAARYAYLVALLMLITRETPPPPPPSTPYQYEFQFGGVKA